MSISFKKILFSKPSPIRQLDAMDCGPACLAYISKIYDKKYSLQYLREICYISKRGVTLLGILEAGKAIGFEVFSTKVDLDTIINKVKLYPCIIHWEQNHFVVLNKIVKTKKSKLYFYLMDPRSGFIKLNEKQFRNGWLGNNDKGIVAFFEPKDEFLNISIEKQKKINYEELLYSLHPYKKKFVLLIFLVFASSLITLVFPFFTKELIDNGISQKNLNLISLILLAQLSLFLGSMIINVIRNWLTLYIGTYVSINLISDFITKLVKLPMKNFDNHMIGDLNQRIIDNERIERLITSESITTFFSIFSFLVFFVVLAYFNIITLVIYFALTLIGLLWSIYWINKKKILDFYEFQLKSKNQESIFEIFSGIRDIKLFQLENFKLTKWQSVQNELLSLNIKILKIDQIQTFGYQFINQLKNIIVTYFVAILVIL
jgi:ATP-binding cassette, subfamily B, bacterial